MDAYPNWLKAQIRFLDKLRHPDQNQFDDLAGVIEEAGRRGARAGLPEAVRVCGKIRGGPLGVEATREVLASCLAACRESGGSDDSPNPERPLTAAEAAKILNISPRKVYDLCAAGAIRHTKNPIRILPADLEAYQLENAEASAPVVKLRHLRA